METDLIKALRQQARESCDRHNSFDEFTPEWKKKPQDFLEWQAAEEIERLQSALTRSCEGARTIIRETDAEIERLRKNKNV